MYIPKHFAVTDRAVMDDIVRTNAFGLLTGLVDGEPFATHLPFILDGDRLLAHFARGNPHWKAMDGKTRMLAVFSGPHAYVSPRWYEVEQAVPTWNYIAVHVYGAPRVIEDRDAVRAMLDRLVAEYEGDAWSLGDRDPDFVDRMSRGIVAFEMPIERIEGKRKLSQNRSDADRARVIAELQSADNSVDTELARLMRDAMGGN